MGKKIGLLLALLLFAGMAAAEQSIWVGGIQLKIPDSTTQKVQQVFSVNTGAIQLELQKAQDSNGNYWGVSYWNYVCVQPSESIAFFTNLSGGWVVGQNCLSILKMKV